MKDIIERIRELPAGRLLRIYLNDYADEAESVGVSTDDLKQMAEELADLRAMVERQISIFAVQGDDGGRAMARYAYGYVLTHPFGHYVDRFASERLDEVMLRVFPDALSAFKKLQEKP